jgi:hypothetical protein
LALQGEVQRPTPGPRIPDPSGPTWSRPGSDLVPRAAEAATLLAQACALATRALALLAAGSAEEKGSIETGERARPVEREAASGPTVAEGSGPEERWRAEGELWESVTHLADSYGGRERGGKYRPEDARRWPRTTVERAAKHAMLKLIRGDVRRSGWALFNGTLGNLGAGRGIALEAGARDGERTLGDVRAELAQVELDRAADLREEAELAARRQAQVEAARERQGARLAPLAAEPVRRRRPPVDRLTPVASLAETMDLLASARLALR